ncbi:MAG: glycosyltransferase [Kofleriaceae bacterium]
MRKRSLVTDAILHVIASLESGGAERQLALLATEQARRGMQVHLAVRRRGPLEAMLQGVHIHELADLAGADLRLVWQLVRFVRTFAPTIVQTWLPQMDVLGGSAALATRVPWVMTERSTDYPRDAALFARNTIGRLASAIVANSVEGAAGWRDAHVIPNAVVVDHPVPTEPPTVVFAGRLDDNKQPHVFVDAIARTRLPAIVFGDGPLRGALESRARDLPIKFAGYRADWHRWLASAIAFVTPSRREGEPNAVLEALAFGRPVIASDIAAHRHLVEPAFAVGDVDGLVRALASPRFTSRVDLANRSLAVTADRYDAVYTSVSARSRARRT